MPRALFAKYPAERSGLLYRLGDVTEVPGQFRQDRIQVAAFEGVELHPQVEQVLGCLLCATARLFKDLSDLGNDVAGISGTPAYCLKRCHKPLSRLQRDPGCL